MYHITNEHLEKRNLWQTSIEPMEQTLAGIRILVLMPSIPVQGMERANLQIMKMLKQRGANVLFVTQKNFGGKVEREVQAIGCGWAGVTLANYYEERLHLTKHVSEMLRVFKAWGRGAWQIDRIYRQFQPTHIHVTNIAAAINALPTLMRTPRTVVFRLPNPPSAGLSRFKQYLSDWVWRLFVIPLCNEIICNSRFTLSCLRKFARTNNVRVIYNCVPERNLLGRSDAPKVSRNHFNIAYIGRIQPVKGVKELVEVAIQLVCEHDNVDFYFAGEQNEQDPFAANLLAEIQRKGLCERIRFVGEIYDVLGLLSQCDLHVCPSVSEEPFGIVVLEAKSQGIPSVVFPSGGLKEAVEHLVDGFICREKSTTALYEGIRYFLDDRAKLKMAGEAALASLERFSSKRIADEWINVFKHA